MTKNQSRYENRVVARQMLALAGLVVGFFIFQAVYNAVGDYTQNNTYMGRMLSGKGSGTPVLPGGIAAAPVVTNTEMGPEVILTMVAYEEAVKGSVLLVTVTPVPGAPPDLSPDRVIPNPGIIRAEDTAVPGGFVSNCPQPWACTPVPKK